MRKILAALLAVTILSLTGKAFAAPTIDLLTDVPFVNGASGTAELPPVFIVDDGTTITVGTDVRLIIPSTFSMIWDTSDLSIEILKFGTGVIASTVSSFANSNQTFQLGVTTASAAGDRFVITGLKVKTWGAEETADQLGMNLINTNASTYASTQFMTIGGVSLSTANNFCFHVSEATPTVPTITITDSSATAVITAASDIYLCIPGNASAYGTAPTWDTSVTTVSLGGTASGSVSSTVSYITAGSGMVARFDVTTNFSASQTLTITGLKFYTPSAAYTTDSLVLAYPTASAFTGPAKTQITAVDSKVFVIDTHKITMSAVMTVAASASASTIPLISITGASTATTDITAGSDIRLIIMGSSTTSVSGGSTGRDNLSFTSGLTPTVESPTAFGGTGVVTTTATPTFDQQNGYGGRMFRMNVTTAFASGDLFRISNMTINNGTSTATKLYIGLIVRAYTANADTSVWGPVISMVTEASATGGSDTVVGTSGGGGCFLRTAGRQSAK